MTISVVLLAFAAFLGGVGLDLASYARTADQLKTWEEAGGRVLVVRSSTGGVDWQECSRLNEVSGVAGAVPVARAQSRFVPAHTPTSSRSLSVTSADIWRFLGRPAAPAEVLVSSRVDTVPGPFVQLTPREMATLRLLADGKANKEIANALDISERTVKSHLAHLFEKLAVTSRTEAIKVATRRGLVRLE